MTPDQTAMEGLVDLYCKELKLPGLRRGYRELAREAMDKGVSHTQFLLSCLEQEAESRKEHRLRSRLRAARFPSMKTLADFDFSVVPTLPKSKVYSLADGQFIRRKENLVCVGPSGTGKTHTVIALGLAAIEAGYRVRFIRTVTLAQELLQAQQDARLNKYLAGWRKVDLVICDEMGYVKLGPGAPLIFQFVAERYETGSLAVTSNLEFSRWEEIFGDAAMTTALLDRLTHHCTVLLFQGESYRFRESARRQQEEVAKMKALEVNQAS
jgi:DNA replication protein DnaC